MRPLFAVLLDAALVVVFAAVGRRSHAEGLDLVGIAGTAWPFLVGAGAGWLVGRLATAYDAASWPFGLIVVAGSVVVGMLLRRLTGGGVQLSFVVVATTALTVFLVGWRLVAARIG